ncbi:lytic transglycosylase domain-containing protein [Rugamonas sp. DEMB1]|uniref:lytic transglycosylase domain-containing protein n=1 Tax=Rugamonas sp. DEMB1 TaxID=3039386 RepID=UPI002449E3B2|nr:lytic transglycosylase domain-containing protein [Rugamonas sp. DEMB1]WGG53580.1 lytic transglycosylase domain-containing protein [Rugamonas sp. DEMB1]
MRAALPRLALPCLALALALAPGAAQACWEEAGARYGVSPQLLYAIAKTESGLNPAAMNRNKNGSYDVGLMQINSSWLPRLRRFGLDERRLLEPCTSIQVGAWILAQNMQRLGYSWDAVGAYNSSKPALRLQYAQRVYRNMPPAAPQRRAAQ